MKRTPRDYAFQVRLTREQGRVLEQKAAMAQLSKSEYARRRITQSQRESREVMPRAEAPNRNPRRRQRVKPGGGASAQRACRACGPVCGPRCTHYCHTAEQGGARTA